MLNLFSFAKRESKFTSRQGFLFFSPFSPLFCGSRSRAVGAEHPPPSPCALRAARDAARRSTRFGCEMIQEVAALSQRMIDFAALLLEPNRQRPQSRFAGGCFGLSNHD